MSTINLHNYEAFFLDYHEGNLSASEIDVLMQFIEQNEDLQEELFSFQSVKLVDSEVKFAANSELKNPDGISENEALIIGYLEGGLSKKDSAEFTKLYAENRDFKDEHNAFSKTKLVNENVAFQFKKELKQTRNIVPFLISSSLILVISIFLIYPFFTDEANRSYYKMKRDYGNGISFPLSKPALNTLKKQEAPQHIVKSMDNDQLTRSASSSKPKSHPIKLSVETPPINVMLDTNLASPVLENKNNVTTSNKEDSFLKPKEFIVKSLDKKINGATSNPSSNISLFLEKTIEKVTKKETIITSSETKKRKKFSIKIGRFEYSKNKNK